MYSAKTMSAFPYEIQDLDPEINEKLREAFIGLNGVSFVQVSPKKYKFFATYRKYAEEIYNFHVRPDDTWVVTFPRSGTTLMQELVWLIANDLDFDTASKVSLNRRFPFIDLNFIIPPELKESLRGNVDHEKTANDTTAVESLTRSFLENIKEENSPRFIKSHLPFSLLPQSLLDIAKCITVVRNPKDVAISYFYHNRFFKGLNFSKDFTTYWDYFENDLLYPCPYWEHIKESWELRHHPNILFLFYEDIVTDWKGCIRKVAKFLGKTLTDDQVDKLADHMLIDNFRKNKSVNTELDKIPIMVNENEPGLIRQGKNYGSKNEYTAELNGKAEEWINHNLLKMPIDFDFPLRKQETKKPRRKCNSNC